MKNILLILVACFISDFASAQHRGFCGTSVEDQVTMLDKREQYQSDLVLENRDGEIFVPLIFHMTAENSGNGRVGYGAVLDQFCRLQEDYADSDFLFYIKEIREINNTAIYQFPGSNGTGPILSEKNNNGKNGVNIFITQNADTGGGLGTTLGFYSPNGDYVIIRKAELNPPSSTLTHELGHFFSLAHPHLGWECEAYDATDHGNPVTVVNTPCASSVVIEYVDFSNCATAGDRICDTPAEYNFPFSQSPSLANQCNYIGNVQDKNGDDLDPMEQNYMGYYSGCNNEEFTQGQYDAMHDNFENAADRAYLRIAYEPTLETLTGSLVVSEPANASTAQWFDQVYFDWNDIPNADHYLIEFTTSAGKFTVITDESEATVTNLEENTSYFYSIRAWNEIDACLTPSSTRTLTTPASSVGVKDISGLSAFSMSPNPTSADAVNLKFELETRQDLEVQIYSTNGQLVLTQNNKSYNAGPNQMDLNISDLRSGIYIVQLRSEDGIHTSKLMVTK